MYLRPLNKNQKKELKILFYGFIFKT